MSHIENLAGLFKSKDVKVFLIGTKLYRGCWLPNAVFPNGSWFSPDFKIAAQYLASGAEHGKKSSKQPLLYECETTKDLRLVELHGNHIEAFASAYDRNWAHDELPQDISKALALLPKVDLDGFIRPCTGEYFVCFPAAVLKEVSYLAGQAALKVASRVKGYEV